MLIFSLFQWWYSSGWLLRWRNVYSKTAELAESFSLGILLKTLFKPWKQITDIGPKESGVGGMTKSMIDNLVSRFVGFWIRLFVLVAGVGYIVIAFIFNATIAIFWPVIPALPLVFIFLSLAAL